MRRLLPLILLISIFIRDASGQPQQKWVQKYHSSGSQDDFLVDMAIDKEGNIYATGWTIVDIQNTNYDIVTIKYNNSGELLWTRTYSGSFGGYDAPIGIEMDDSGYVYVGGNTYDSITGIDFLAIKYNSKGDSIWTRTYNHNEEKYDFARDIYVDGNGNVYITGSGGNTCPLCPPGYLTIKYNSIGELQWASIYLSGGSGSDLPYGIISDTQNNVYITGRTWNAIRHTVKYDSMGDSIWIKGLDTPSVGRQVFIDPKYNVLIRGSNFVCKYDSSGNIMWTYDNGSSGLLDMTVNEDYTSYYLTGQNINGLLVKKLDSSGSLIWEKFYKCSMNSYDVGNSITLDKEENIYIIGTSDCNSFWNSWITLSYTSDSVFRWIEYYNDGTPFLSDSGLIVLTDTSGNIYAGGISLGQSSGWDITIIKYQQLTNLINTSEEIPIDYTLSQNYPNPFNNYTNIEFKIPKKENVILEIYDVLGRKADEKSFGSLESGSYKIQYNADKLSSGVYFYKITTGERSLTKKFLLVK